MQTRTLLMIPGPVEFESEVMQALAAPTVGHVAPEFIEVFGQALERMRELFMCPDGQPFIVAGSGTLAMDLAGANLIEAGDRALVVNTGYFGDRFGALLERYGAEVTHVRAPVGGCPSLDEVEKTLKSGPFKLMTVTHVDTSTGVLTDVQGLAELAHRYDTLIVVDGVCSVAGEALRMAEWGIDVALTASQKAVGTPPGLALLVAGPRALAAFRARKRPTGNFYADWAHWLPIMEAYEARRPAYFGTPAVNLVAALNASLGIILSEGLEARWARHARIGRAFQAAIRALDLEQVPQQPEWAAHTMSAPRYPPGIDGSEFLKRVRHAGVTLAGGLHPQIRAEYFRIGHMGAVGLGELLATVGAIEAGLVGCGHRFEIGAGVRAAMAAYMA